MQQFAAFSQSADAACLLHHGGGTSECLYVHTTSTVTWDTAGTTTIGEDRQIGGAVDTLTATWLIVASTTGATYLIDQKFQLTLSALVAGDWAIWGRVVDGRVESFSQVPQIP